MPADTPASLSHCWHLGPEEALEAKAQKETFHPGSKHVKTGVRQEHSRRPGFHGFFFLLPRTSSAPTARQAALPVLFRSPRGTLKCAHHVCWGQQLPGPQFLGPEHQLV